MYWNVAFDSLVVVQGDTLVFQGWEDGTNSRSRLVQTDSVHTTYKAILTSVSNITAIRARPSVPDPKVDLAHRTLEIGPISANNIQIINLLGQNV